jgi:hypothetical protein
MRVIAATFAGLVALAAASASDQADLDRLDLQSTASNKYGTAAGLRKPRRSPDRRPLPLHAESGNGQRMPSFRFAAFSLAREGV